jgi:hypothetical protein
MRPDDRKKYPACEARFVTERNRWDRLVASRFEFSPKYLRRRTAQHLKGTLLHEFAHYLQEIPDFEHEIYCTKATDKGGKYSTRGIEAHAELFAKVGAQFIL